MIAFLAWRKHRRGLVAFSVSGFLLSFFYGFAFLQAAGTSAAQRADFGRVSTLAARQFAFLIPLPTHPETLGGYEQFKWLSAATIMWAIWAVLVGVGVARGDEDGGLSEEWLVAGVSRTRLLLSRSLAFGLVLLAACLASVLGISAVAPLVQSDPNVAGEIGKAVSSAVGVFSLYALALFLSQLPAERQTGTALGVGAMVVLLIVNGMADTVPSLAGIGVVSPFHWMEVTTSAAPGGVFDLPATLVLVAAAALLVGVAGVVFERRDLGRGVLAWGSRSHTVVRVASRNVMLRYPFTEGLWEQRVGLSVWAVSMLLLASVMVSITRSMTDALTTDRTLAAMFQSFMHGPLYAAFLGFLWFSIALLLLAGYAVVQVSRWSAQDQEGRVEMLLTTPVSRTRVVIDRAIEFAIASLVLVIAGYIGVAAKLPSAGLGIDAGQVFAASAMLWPFALAFGGLGVAVASRWPRVAVPAVGAFVGVQYFLGDLAPIFRAPGWVANLSVFHLYGNPLVGTVTLGPVLSMGLVFVGGFGVALVFMRSRDLAGA